MSPEADGAANRGDTSTSTSSSSMNSVDTAVRWTCIASANDLRKVSSARVRFTCIDATRAWIVLGANTGSAYVFARSRAGESATRKIEAREREARFITVVSPEVLEDNHRSKFGTTTTNSTTRSSRSALQSVSAVRVSPCGRLCALGYADGTLRVVHMTGLTTEETRRSTLGETVACLLTSHKGRPITELTWSNHTGTVYAGSDQGVVTKLSCMAFLEWCGAGGVGAKPAIVNKTEFTEVDSAIHQLNVSPSDRHVVMSAQSSAQLMIVEGDNAGVITRIGSKAREGAYGSCFHKFATVSLDEDEDDSDDEILDDAAAMSKIVEYGVIARPGRKMWIAKVRNVLAEADVEIMATIKPEAVQPSSAPGWERKEMQTDASTRLSKKLEFGLLHAFGPCMLSITEKAIAIVDLASPAISRWYPLKEPGSEKISAGYIDACVCDHRAFFLTPSDGEGHSVWCLESFVDTTALVDDISRDTSLTAVMQAMDVCQRTNTFNAKLFNRAKELVESADEGVQERLAMLIRWGENVGSRQTLDEEEIDDPREESFSEENAASPVKSPEKDPGKPPLGRSQVANAGTPVGATITAATDFPKAESDGGIFFYNPRGMSKNAPADGQKKASKKVKKRQVQVVDDASQGGDLSKVSVKKKESKSVKKDFSVDVPTCDTEWDECDQFDAGVWQADVDRVSGLLPINGAPFEHWSSYNCPEVSVFPPNDVPSETFRMRLRIRTKTRVATAIECVEKLMDCKTSLDASPLVIALRRWRAARQDFYDLLSENGQGENVDVAARVKARIEGLLAKLDALLNDACAELQFEQPKPPATPISSNETTSPDIGQSPSKTVTLTNVIDLLSTEQSIEIGEEDENDCVASLRAANTASAKSALISCLSSALTRFVSRFATEAGGAADLEETFEAHMRILARVGTAALGPKAVIVALTSACEEKTISRAISPIRTHEAVSKAISRVFVRITAFLTAENSAELGLRRNAAQLIEPLHEHLTSPPAQAYGRFRKLQASLEAELSSDPTASNRVDFVQSHSKDEKAPSWSLKPSYERLTNSSLEDRGDWGAKMDLSECPACARSLTSRGNRADIVTYPCGHCFHAYCALESACLECLNHRAP